MVKIANHCHASLDGNKNRTKNLLENEVKFLWMINKDPSSYVVNINDKQFKYFYI